MPIRPPFNGDESPDILEGHNPPFPHPALHWTSLPPATAAPVETPAFPRAMKRLVDIAGATLLLCLLLPVLAVVALAVSLSSPGGAFYKQHRVGRASQTFTIWKFRSMYANADERRAELQAANETTGPVFKIRADPRVTPVGRVIRKFSLDELPQLVNVLRGDMSLVGPRPPLLDEFATYTERELARLAVKPGLTCTWQVSGRSDIDFDTWVNMDLEYIRDWSLWLDLKLLVRTVPAVLSGKGAY